MHLPLLHLSHLSDLPGMEGYLTTRFVPDEQAWRDRHIFNIAAPDIRRVVVTFPSYPDSSFQLDIAGPDSFSLYNYRQQLVRASKQRVAFYLFKIAQVRVEALINQSLSRDTTVQSKPFCVLTITDAKGRVQTSRFYRKAVTRSTQEQTDPKTNMPVPYDLDRALALIRNDSDFVLVQYRTINYLMPRLQDLMFKK